MAMRGRSVAREADLALPEADLALPEADLALPEADLALPEADLALPASPRGEVKPILHPVSDRVLDLLA